MGEQTPSLKKKDKEGGYERGQNGGPVVREKNQARVIHLPCVAAKVKGKGSEENTNPADGGPASVQFRSSLFDKLGKGRLTVEGCSCQSEHVGKKEGTTENLWERISPETGESQVQGGKGGSHMVDTKDISSGGGFQGDEFIIGKRNSSSARGQDKPVNLNCTRESEKIGGEGPKTGGKRRGSRRVGRRVKIFCSHENRFDHQTQRKP